MWERSFARLESLLSRVVERVESIETEKNLLKQENSKLKQNLEELERQNRARGQEIDRLKEDQVKLRWRVQRVMDNVAVLEESLEAETAPPEAETENVR